MNNKISWAALVLALLALIIVLVRSGEQPQASVAKPETAFERVMRTGTLRCGYLLSPAWVMKDPNTGAMSGTIVDYVNALGAALSLKVVWQEEINLGTYMQDLQNGRYDLECSGGWPNALRGKQIDYSNPIYYFPMYAVARADDSRFDNNYEAMNNSSVRIVGYDGGTNAIIRDQRFPHSTPVDLPGIVSNTDAYLNVISGKADVTFDDYATIAAFDKANPNKIRKVSGEPLRIIPANLSFAPGEFRLQQMINTATNQLMYDGVIDRIIDKYEPFSGIFLRVAAPYTLPAK